MSIQFTTVVREEDLIVNVYFQENIYNKYYKIIDVNIENEYLHEDTYIKTLSDFIYTQ